MIDEPTPGERARTILACSPSALVTGAGPGGRGLPRELSARTMVLCTDPVTPGASAVPVQVEVADASPLATRERIRARVRIAGRAVSTEGCDALHVHPRRVTLADGGEQLDVDVADLVAARPDPLHEVEASMLGHLESRHGDVVETLTRLVGAKSLQGVVRVWPYRLDRHGLVLRLEYASGHADQRLPFAAPISSPHQLQTAMAALLERARTHVPPCARPRLTGPLSSILRAGDAVRRVCSTEHDDPTG